MIAVLQRTLKASVAVDDKIVGNINSGLVILLGIKKGDSNLNGAVQDPDMIISASIK